MTLLLLTSHLILLKSVCLSVCRCSQTAGRNSCSIVSGDVSNCSYRMRVHPVTSSRLFGLAFFLYVKNIHKLTIAKANPRAYGC